MTVLYAVYVVSVMVIQRKEMLKPPSLLACAAVLLCI